MIPPKRPFPVNNCFKPSLKYFPKLNPKIVVISSKKLSKPFKRWLKKSLEKFKPSSEDLLTSDLNGSFLVVVSDSTFLAGFIDSIVSFLVKNETIFFKESDVFPIMEVLEKESSKIFFKLKNSS